MSRQCQQGFRNPGRYFPSCARMRGKSETGPLCHDRSALRLKVANPVSDMEAEDSCAVPPRISILAESEDTVAFQHVDSYMKYIEGWRVH
jgi:hypothetical protein